jgi:plasmid stabilization system protein ParE
MNYQLTDRAMDDLREAVRFYELQGEGLGARFMIEVGIGIARVLDAPTSWPEIEPGVQKYRIDRYPYALLYHLPSPRTVQFIAVFDLRRQPGSWRR